MRTATQGTRRGRLAIVAVLLALLLTDLMAAPAQAAVTRSDYLPKSVVKAKMSGQGTWYRALGEYDVKPVGATPAECRSDLPLARARQTRDAYYWGPVAASTSYYGHVRVTVARFRTKLAATRAMGKISAWVPACPTTVEWSCTQCDGIAEFHRRPAKQREVGTESYAWRERTVGMGQSKGRAIAARRGRTIVIVVAAHLTDPTELTAPVAPTWRAAVVLTRRSLARATA